MVNLKKTTKQQPPPLLTIYLHFFNYILKHGRVPMLVVVVVVVVVVVAAAVSVDVPAAQAHILFPYDSFQYYPAIHACKLPKWFLGATR
jgi:hypothetical protein